MPMSPTLIEAIAGRETAEGVARDIGLTHWDARHQSDAFTFTRPFALTAIGTLHGITARYGMRTAHFVAMQLEYPRSGGSQ